MTRRSTRHLTGTTRGTSAPYREGKTIEDYKEHVRDPKVVCWLCWRVLNDRDRLCHPLPL